MTDSAHTIGVEFGTRIIEIQGKKIKLQVCEISFLFFISIYSHTPTPSFF